jgi:hypothetical protein
MMITSLLETTPKCQDYKGGAISIIVTDYMSLWRKDSVMVLVEIVNVVKMHSKTDTLR